MRYIIIGGSIAGISAAQALRAADRDAGITMFSDEPTKAYYRPMIPLILEKKDLDVTFPESPSERYRFSMVYEKAAAIDAQRRHVLDTSGKAYPFDKLLIATGSSAVMPDVPGLNGEGALPLRTLEHALGIRQYASPGKKAVILGGGFVGTKAAISLNHAGVSVTVVEKLDQILYGRLDKRASQIIAGLLREAGISIRTGDTVTEVIRSGGKVSSVILSSGETLSADFVVIAAGSSPNTVIAGNTGITVSRGILVDETLQTSIPDIYAAGDCVEYTDLITGKPSASVLWTNAEEMGRTAGKNMSGAGLKYRGFLAVMNSTEVLGVPVISIGLIEPEGKGYEVVTEDSIDSYRKLVFKDDLLVGAIFIGEVIRPGIYTNLIRNRIPAGRLKEEAIRGDLSFIDFMRPIPLSAMTS